MPSIPKNNLKEHMLKLNYNPNLVKITPPVINYVPPPPSQAQQPTSTYKLAQTIQQSTYQQQQTIKFDPPQVVNLEEWSDFEDD